MCTTSNHHTKSLSSLQTVLLSAFSIYLRFWHRWRIVGACRIPATGPAIIVANHTGDLDPPILLIASPSRLIRFVAARRLFKRPFIGGLIQWSCKLDGAIPVDLSVKSLASLLPAIRALQEGDLVGIFPEGPPDLDCALKFPKKGAAVLALLSGAPVIPVYIRGTPPHRSTIGDFLRRGNVQVHFGEPLLFSRQSGKLNRDYVRTVSEQIMNAIVDIGSRVENQSVADGVLVKCE